MSLAKFIEERIREAMEASEFDNLEGAGKPISLEDYFDTPADLRMGYSVLKSAKIVPEEISRLKEISELKEKIRNCADETGRGKLNKTLQERQLALALSMERSKRRKMF